MLGGVGVICVDGITREALRLVTIRIQLRARVSVTARLIFVTALDGWFIFPPSQLRAGCYEHQGGGCLEYYTFSHRMHNEHAQQSAAAILPCSLYEIQFVLVSIHPKKLFFSCPLKKSFLSLPG